MSNNIFFQVPRDQAVIVARWYFKAKKITSANMQNLKAACKELYFVFKDINKRGSPVFSGQILFGNPLYTYWNG